MVYHEVFFVHFYNCFQYVHCGVGSDSLDHDVNSKCIKTTTGLSSSSMSQTEQCRICLVVNDDMEMAGRLALVVFSEFNQSVCLL